MGLIMLPYQEEMESLREENRVLVSTSGTSGGEVMHESMVLFVSELIYATLLCTLSGGDREPARREPRAGERQRWA